MPIKSGLSVIGALVPAYSPDSREKDDIVQLVKSVSGVAALSFILRRKKTDQENKIDSKIYAITAKTGAGKSTFMIYELFKQFVMKLSRKAHIICTQPKVLWAQGNAIGVTKIFPELKLGFNVGYSTGSGKIVPTNNQSILYVTTQTLSNMIMRSKAEAFGRRNPIIVIDEAHDLSTEMLTTLRTLRDYIQANYKESWCPKVIVTSATIYPPKFIDYFGGDPYSPLNTGYVSGLTNYPIIQKYLTESEAVGNIVDTSVNKCIEFLSSNQDLSSPEFRSILIIHKGKKEITKSIEMLHRLIQKELNAPTYEAATVYHRTSPPVEARTLKRWYTICALSSVEIEDRKEDYLITTRNLMEGEFRIFVATPVVEAGITLNGLGLVLDAGRHYQPIPFPLQNVLSIVPLPMDALAKVQRTGRVGRTFSGIYHGLYTKAAGDKMMPEPYPSPLMATDASMILLRLATSDHVNSFLEFSGSISGVNKLIGFNKAGLKFPSFDLLNSPRMIYNFSFDTTLLAFRTLCDSGAMDRFGNITNAGYQLSLIDSSSFGLALLKLMLMRDMIHMFDINLLSGILSQCFLNFKIGEKLRCADSMDRYFIDPLSAKTGNVSIRLFEICQQLVHKLSEGKPLSAWAESVGIKLSKVMPIVNDALSDDYTTDLISPYVDASPDEKIKILNSCTRAISWFETLEPVKTMELKKDPRDHFM